MKYILSTVGEFYEVFNKETMTTVYVSDKRAKVVEVVNNLNLGKVKESDLKQEKNYVKNFNI